MLPLSALGEGTSLQFLHFFAHSYTFFMVSQYQIMRCDFVFTAHCSDIVRDKSTLRPHLAHAGVGVAWAKRGHDSGKVWERLRQSVVRTQAKRGQD